MAAVIHGGSAAEPPTRDLKSLAFGKEPERARALFELTRDRSAPLGARWLEAMSWVGRAGAIAGDWEQAAEYSERTMEGCEALLESTELGTDPNAPLAIALGAAIETLGKVYMAAGDRTQAVSFLREQQGKYGGSGIETRLNKNLLLLDLAGKPMPPLNVTRWLGSERFEAADLKGSVVLFFFWAHWCEDCRAQKPILERLERQFGKRGFRVVAPTRLYGYVTRGHSADAATETAYIQADHVAASDLLRTVPVPLDQRNFVAFGVSTTPTLVLVDREGTVRLYHPGEMTESDLAERIKGLL